MGFLINPYNFAVPFDKTGLKVYWKFNQTSGLVTNDATAVGSADSLGIGADLTISGATYNNTNSPFNTMNFDGIDDKGTAGTSLSQFNFMHNGGKWTVCMWVEIADDTEEGLLWSNTTGTNTHGTNMLQATDKKLVFRVFDSAIWVNLNLGLHGMTNGTQYFLTFTFDKDEATNKATFYKNATEIATGNQSTTQGTPTNSAAALQIASQGAGGYLAIQIAEMSIWNRILSDGEISTLYGGGSGKAL